MYVHFIIIYDRIKKTWKKVIGQLSVSSATRPATHGGESVRNVSRRS